MPAGASTGLGVSGEAGAQFRTHWPHPLFALGHGQPTDALCFQFGSADSNRFSDRAGRLVSCFSSAGRLESFFGSRRPTDRGLYYFGRLGRFDLVLCAIA